MIDFYMGGEHAILPVCPEDALTWIQAGGLD